MGTWKFSFRLQSDCQLIFAENVVARLWVDRDYGALVSFFKTRAEAFIDFFTRELLLHKTFSIE